MIALALAFALCASVSYNLYLQLNREGHSVNHDHSYELVRALIAIAHELRIINGRLDLQRDMLMGLNEDFQAAQAAEAQAQSDLLAKVDHLVDLVGQIAAGASISPEVAQAAIDAYNASKTALDAESAKVAAASAPLEPPPPPPAG